MVGLGLGWGEISGRSGSWFTVCKSQVLGQGVCSGFMLRLYIQALCSVLEDHELAVIEVGSKKLSTIGTEHPQAF